MGEVIELFSNAKTLKNGYEAFEKYPEAEGGFRAEIEQTIENLFTKLAQLNEFIAFLSDAVRVLDEDNYHDAIEIKMDLEKAKEEYEYLLQDIESMESIIRTLDLLGK